MMSLLRLHQYGEPDGLSVDESLEYITALIAIAEHG